MEYISNGLLIKQLHDCLERRANNDLRPKDLTMMQMAVLMVLREAEGKQLAMKALERHFQVAQSTIAGVISRLERKGFVEAIGDAADKRIKLAHITAAGESCCEEAAKYQREAEEAIVRGFSQEEQAIFNNLLARAADNIKDNMQ